LNKCSDFIRHLHTCFQLGRQPEYPDTRRKLALLANALQLCPPENVLDVLAAWRRVESESIQGSLQNRNGHRGTRARERANVRRDRLAHPGGISASIQAAAGQLPSLSARLLSMPMANAQLPMTPDAAAAMASRTFNRMAGVAANLSTFSLRGRLQDDETSSSRSSEVGGRPQGSDVSQQARAVFTRGVGWLIGADDE